MFSAQICHSLLALSMEWSAGRYGPPLRGCCLALPIPCADQEPYSHVEQYSSEYMAALSRACCCSNCSHVAFGWLQVSTQQVCICLQTATKTYNTFGLAGPLWVRELALKVTLNFCVFSRAILLGRAEISLHCMWTLLLLWKLKK